MTKYLLGSLLCLLLLLQTACGEHNPLMKMDIAKFNRFVQKNEYAKLANICAKYYVQGKRLKVTTASRVCSTFTRELSRQAQREKFVIHASYKHFRDPRLWKNWLDYVNVKGTADKARGRKKRCKSAR